MARNKILLKREKIKIQFCQAGMPSGPNE